jgi:hypothetical protein
MGLPRPYILRGRGGFLKIKTEGERARGGEGEKKKKNK